MARNASAHPRPAKPWTERYRLSPVMASRSKAARAVTWASRADCLVGIEEVMSTSRVAGTAVDLANFRARNWPRILRRAGVRPRTLYQCRHTFARLAIEHGDTPQHVAAQLGHASVRMVFEVYGRWMKRPQSAAMEALDRAVSITHPSPIFGGESTRSGGRDSKCYHQL